VISPIKKNSEREKINDDGLTITVITVVVNLKAMISSTTHNAVQMIL
jgi:hypothetical protein